MKNATTALANAWLGVLVVGLIAMGLALANRQASPLPLRLTWFVAVIPLSIGVIAALRDLRERQSRSMLHLRILPITLLMPGVFFLIQMVIFKMEDAAASPGPAALGSPAGDATAMVLYMALWWSLVLFASAFLLDMFRPMAEASENRGEGTPHAS